MVAQPSEHHILIVDDEPALQEIFRRLLEAEGFHCYTAASGDEALKRLSQLTFSLMITDINMEGMSGIDLLRVVRGTYSDLAVIMASAVNDRQVAVQALELGAIAYVIKPVSRNELIINVINALRWRSLELSHRRQNEKLEELVLQRTQKLQKAKEELLGASEEMVLRLMKAAEFRDDDTAKHTLRMSHYCKIVASGLGFDAKHCELIRLASQLHDVGKIGIPDAILLKPGKLTADEFSLMKEHAEFGYRILSNSRATLLQVGSVIARRHHEKYDGSGYPDGIAGDAIPIEARIAAVGDVFDALTTKRIYKDAMSVESAVEILLQGEKSHFDPQLVEIFLRNMEQVVQIQYKFRDTEE